MISKRLRVGLPCGAALSVPAAQNTLAMDPSMAVPALSPQTVQPVESASEVLERLFVDHPHAWERFHTLLEDAHGFAVFPGCPMACAAAP